MSINEKTLDTIMERSDAGLEALCNLYIAYVNKICAPFDLIPYISKDRIAVAHSAFVEDIDKLKATVPQTGGKSPGPCEYKIVAFLAFWLRREKPLITLTPRHGSPPWPDEICVGGFPGDIEFFDEEFKDDLASQSVDEDSGGEYVSVAKSLKKLFINYHNEYAAFNIGLDICKYYQVNSKKRKSIGRDFPEVFITYSLFYDACYYLARRNVSPHALYLTYKGVFEAIDYAQAS